MNKKTKKLKKKYLHKTSIKMAKYEKKIKKPKKKKRQKKAK